MDNLRPVLLITLAFPLYAILSKSFSTYAFNLDNFENPLPKNLVEHVVRVVRQLPA